MMQKWCGRCKRHSFSSGDWYRWICPYCNKDLTMQKASPATIRFILVRPFAPYRYTLTDSQLLQRDENTA
ncbi:hypothetical protein [Brevibacillus choshinensis]|uniref:Transposase zinc-ribbon domain-containing protein n=1 Tax=Brevibacillus choshinensis TaxID=54911 RepID=A0ABX7FS10_BRECH|nr:hypothetical protein [Brevibacillus choshinensis]QRG68106.1 hypothetical protein JNE38_02535 [Brevibacillus choshinensis]